MVDESVLQQESLLGRLILDYDTTEELGLVDGLLVDLNQGNVVALVCKAPVWQRQRSIYSWGQILNIGGDSIVLHGHSTEMSQSAAAQPMVGLEVWTDTGNCVGQIVDYRFERSGTVVQYLFAKPGQVGLYGLAPNAIISAGRKRMMVSASSVEQSEYFADAEVPMAQPDWQATAQTTAQSLADQMQQRAQEWSDYAQEHWLSEDFNEQLRSTGQQLQDKTQGLRSQFNQQVSNARKRIKPLNRALENTLENALDTLNEQNEQTESSDIDLDAFEVWEDDD